MTPKICLGSKIYFCPFRIYSYTEYLYILCYIVPEFPVLATQTKCGGIYFLPFCFKMHSCICKINKSS